MHIAQSLSQNIQSARLSLQSSELAELATPPPSPPASKCCPGCPPPPLVPTEGGGRAVDSLAGGRVGAWGPNSDEGTDTLVL
jgi:hypothetical protein